MRQTHYHSKPILEELESRQLFSAGVEGLLTEPMLDPNAVYANANPAPVAETQQPPAQNSGNQAPRNEIVFVDTRVDGYQTLLNDIKSSDVSDRNLEIIALDSNSDGIQQISQVLAERDNLDAVHIISHGSDGSLDLGNSQLNFDTLIRNQTDISAWGDSFNQNGDILLYGCNVAETQFGQSFVDYLAGITNTEIAASADATGSADLGGDWQLEYQTGEIDTQIALSEAEQSNWEGLMAVTANGSISSTNSTSASSLTWSHGVATGTNSALFVEIALDDPTVNVNSVTYGGVALTQVGRSANNHAVEIWTLVNPTVGSANIVVSLSGTTGVAAGATNYNGVAQSTAYYGFVGASGTGTTASVTVASASGDLVIDSQYWQGIPSGGAVGSGQTLLWQRQNAVLTGGSTSEAGAASVVMSGSFSSSAQWEIAAVSIKAASTWAPTITTSGGSLAYTENAAATIIDSALTVSDADGSYLANATVSISSGFVSGQDTLAFTNQNGITGSWNASTGVLTLTGNASAATYQTALRSITYVNSSDAPSTATRTVSFTVNDGSSSSATATRNITITAVNDAPVNTVPSAQTTNEDTNKVFSSANGNAITIADVDAGGANNEITLTVTNGTLTLAGTTGLTFVAGDGTADATVTFRGTANAINTALNGLTYTPTANYNGSATLTVSTKDSVLLSLDIDTSLKGRYTFDNTGALGTDTSPAAAYNGTVVNGTSVNDATRGNVLSLAGDGYIQTTGRYGDSANVTLAAWVNASSVDTNGGEVISLGDSVAVGLNGSGQVRGFFYSGGTWTETVYSTSIVGTGWHHLAYSFNDAGNAATLYVDGVQVGTLGTTASISYTLGANSFIGKHGNNLTTVDFSGKIDDARIYSRALTADEIATLASDLTKTDTDTVAVTVAAVNDAPNDLYAINGMAESSLVGVYGFNNPSSLGRDDAGNNAPITFYGNPGQTIGPSGSGALDLAGGSSGQYGDIVGITTGGAMTFAASVRFDSTGDWQRVFDFGQTTSGGIGNVYVGREWNTNNLTFTIEKNGVYTYRATASNAISNGSWLHFAATVDATGNMNLYVNGNLAASTAGVALETGVRSNNFIGKSHWGGDAAFDGAIDNFVVANGVMSASQVAALYQQTSGFTVAENAANGTVIGTVVGFDVDASANPTYSLTDSAGGRFAINATNGTLTVADGSLLNYEAATSHSITVQVTDSLGASYSETYTVNLSNVVEAPSATNLSASETYTEDTPLNLTDIVITRGDSATVTATLTLSNAAAGSLNTGTSGAVTSTYNAATGVWTASGAVADVNTLLAGLTFTPATNFNSNFTIATSISDGVLAAVTGTKAMTGIAVNDAPVINVVSARTTNEDVVKRFSAWIGNAITISDADAGSSNLEMTISATNGTVTLGGLVGLTFSVGDGTADTTMTFRGTLAAINTALDNIDYMPDPNYSGPGGMQFTLNDLGNTGTGGGLVVTATQVITVNPVNDAPTATITPASYSATEQTSLTLHGTGLSIADVDAGSSSVQATLSVVSGTLTASAGTTGVTVSGSGTSSITLTGSLSQINALLAGNASGSLSYIINSDTPPATDTLTLSVNDQGNTGSGGALTGFDVATINITAVNDAPVNTIYGDGTIVPEDSVIQLLGSVVIADADSGSGTLTTTLSVSAGAGVLSATSAAGVTISGSGTNTLVLSGDVASINAYFGSAATAPVFTATADYNGAVSFTVVTTDNGNSGSGGALSDSDTISGSISAVADIVNDSVTTNEDTPVTFDPLANDTFENSGRYISAIDGTSVSSGQTVAITGGSVTLNANGSLTFTPTANSNGATSFSYTVTSGVTTETATVALTVNPVNDTPVLTSASLTLNEGQTVTLTAANFGVTDPDSSSLTYTLGSISGGYFQLTTNPGVAVTSFSTAQLGAGQVQFVDDGNEVAPSFSVTVSDGVLNSNTLAATVNYTSVNDAPHVTWAGNYPFGTDEDTASAGISVNTLIMNGPVGSVGYSDADGSSLKGMAVIAKTGSGSWEYSTDGVSWNDFGTVSNTHALLLESNTQVRYVPNGSGAEVAQLQIRGWDQTTDTASSNLAASYGNASINDYDHAYSYEIATVTCTVSSINDAPTLANAIADQNATEDSAFSFQIPANSFADIDAGDSLSYSATLADGSALPSWLAFNPVNRTFSGTPLNADVGSISVRVTVTDSSNASVFDDFTITVANTNDTPTVANPIADQNATEDSAFSFQVPANTFADVDVGDALSYTATLADGSALPNWLTFNAATQTFSGTPANADVGSISVRVTGADNNGATVYDDFALTVTNVNDAPVLNLTDNAFTFVENASHVRIGSSATLVDVDSPNFAGGTLTAIITGNGTAEDRLYLVTQGSGPGQVQVVNANVFIDGNLVATTVGGAGAGSPLVVSFTANADASAVQAVANRVSFRNVSENPSGLQRTVEMVVTDGDGGTSNTDSVLINVTPVNDAPVMTAASLTLNEGQTVTLTGANFSISDPDNTSFTYTVSNVTGGYFQLSGNAGVGVTSFSSADLTGGLVQFVDDGNEVAPSFSVTVNDGALDSNTLAATINYTAVNDNAPVISSGSSASVNENSAASTVVYTASGSDTDGDSLSWSLSGTDAALLSIDATTGEVTLNAAADYESKTSYSFNVVASDGTFSSSQAVTLTVINLNDNTVSTITDSNSGSNTVNENAVNGTVVGITALATDADAGATISYSLTDDAGGRFAIDSNTGVVTLADGSLLDYETATSHSITVRATSSDGSTNSQSFTIAVSNLNDNPVSAISDSNASANSVAENAANGTVVGITALATDADTGATISYSLSDDAGGRFAIDSNTGVVTVADGSLLDYETATSHSITILATSSDGSTNSQTFSIAVTNVNDNPVSTLTDSNATANSVAENAANGTVVGITALATDADSGATISYSLSDNAGGRFAIDSSTGVVTVADGSLLDYESATSHSITVLATSSDGSTNSQTFSIAVTNVNDNAPVLSSADMTLSEGQTVTLAVSNFGVSDPDNTSFSYIVSNVSGGYFQIASNPGVAITSFTTAQLVADQIQFVDDGDEAAPSFSVTVNDGALESNTVAATINYTGVNDAPVIGSATLSLSQGQTVTLSAANFGVSDPDSASFTYTVSSVSGGYFQLTGNPGASVTSFSSVQLAAGQVQFVDDGNEVVPNFSVTVNDGCASSNLVNAEITYSSSDDNTNGFREIIRYNQTNVSDRKEQTEQSVGDKVLSSAAIFDQVNNVFGESVAVSQIVNNEIDGINNVDILVSVDQGLSEVDKSNVKLSAYVPDNLLQEQRRDSVRKQNFQLKNAALEQYSIDTESVLSEQEEIEFWNRLDHIRQQMSDPDAVADANPVNVKIILGTSASLTAGFVSWILRAGSLMASFMSTVPLLKRFDPLPVLRSARKDADSVAGSKKDRSSNPADSEDSDK
ncbi:cadherin-like domain-containing protein [Methylomonas koyamae]|uniref:cadherin-like domain-containing protein n=1 Tax=Methylomonas koyamae TaxID=702114 RepID=UPI00164263C9|nr:cadherin-like domain-containing protein [Methylomonas koyamae]